MNRIYNLEHGVVNVYEMIPKNTRIKEFKEEQLELIPDDERVLIKDNNIGYFTKKEKFLVLNDNYGLMNSHSNKSNKKDEDEILLNKYINGEFEGNDLGKYLNIAGNRIVYDLSTDDEYSKKFIQLTKKAYLLELLQNEKYLEGEFNGSDLDFLSELFIVPNNPSARLDFKTLVCYHNSGLIKNDFNDTLDLINSSSKVYEKLRK